jgi:hypothetical protein
MTKEREGSSRFLETSILISLEEVNSIPDKKNSKLFNEKLFVGMPALLSRISYPLSHYRR